MSNAATWSGEAASVVAGERSSAMKRAMVLSVIILLATAGTSIALYLAGQKALPKRPKLGELHSATGNPQASVELQQRADRLTLSLTTVILVGGTGCLAPLLLASLTWRRRVQGQLQQKAE